MRYTFLAVLLLVSLQILAQDSSAPAVPELQNKDYIAELRVPAETLGTNLFDRIQVRPSRRWADDPGIPLGGNDQCYTMHSIIVRKPRRDSDEVRKTGERTCTLASRFKFKNAAPKVK